MRKGFLNLLKMTTMKRKSLKEVKVIVKVFDYTILAKEAMNIN